MKNKKSTFQAPKKQFTVYEDEWVNGGSGIARWGRSDYKGDSALLNEEGNRCCVGFLAQACGLEDNDISDVGYLDDMSSSKVTKKSMKGWQEMANKLLHGADPEGDRGHPDNIYAINDNEDISHETRKARLKEQFRKQLGLEVIFKPTRPNKKKRDEDKSKKK